MDNRLSREVHDEELENLEVHDHVRHQPIQIGQQNQEDRKWIVCIDERTSSASPGCHGYDDEVVWIDASIGTPGHLTVPRGVRYYLDHKKIPFLLSNWKWDERFQKFQDCIIKEIKIEKQKTIMENLPTKFFKIMLEQLTKHNSRYTTSWRVMKLAFGEFEIGQIVACFLLRRPSPETAGKTFKSLIQRTKIDLDDFSNWIKTEISELSIDELDELPMFQQFKSALTFIADGNDIWDKALEAAAPHRNQVLKTFGPEPRSAQSKERLVKQTEYIKRTGKREKTSTCVVLASNDFIKDCSDYSSANALLADEEETAEDDDSDHSPAPLTKQTRKNRLRGPKKVKFLHKVVLEKLDQLCQLGAKRPC